MARVWYDKLEQYHCKGEIMERNTLLIVDDVEMNREMLRFIFEDKFDILEAGDGDTTLRLIEEHGDRIALLFLDIIMPGKSGLEVLEYMVEHNYMEYIPVVIITGEESTDTATKAYEYGASDIVYKPFVPKVIMQRTLNLIELFSNRIDIENKLEERTKQLKESQEQLKKQNDFLINALSSVVEFRSLESGEHIQRVKYYTWLLLKYLVASYPEYGLTKDAVDLIVSASALHDLGKIAIPDNILLKPGRLTKEEFEEMKKHTTYGCDLLENFKQDEDDFYRYCYEICRYHHERHDGRGYPDGLKGDDIPIWAQVVAIADVYDALVSKRVYKAAYALDEAAHMILNGECGVFSPVILDCFQQAKEEFFKATKMKLSFADVQK
jgi:response regulator RpfG family c-di-GMP phosphodiesterase